MIWSTAVSIIFFAGVALFLVRFISEAGVTFPKNRVMSAITADKTPKSAGETTTARECLYVFLFALAFRIVVYLCAWIACGIFNGGQAPGFIEYCSKWNLWDSPHYLDVAQYGYAHYDENGQHLFLVFFPLYPIMVKLLALIVRNYVVSALLVSTLCYSAGCVMVYKLVTIDYSKSIARTSVVLLSVSPFAFFFGGIMTEGLFVLVIISMFYAIRKHEWWIAGILGILASLTRSVGVLMVIPAAVEWVQSERPIAMMRDKDWKTLGKSFVRFLPAALTPVGILIYLYINYRVDGDPFVFMKYQSEHWSQNLQYFGKTIKMLFNYSFIMGGDWTVRVCMYIPGLFSMTFAAIAVLLSVRRMRSVYTSFMIVYFLFNAAASWPISGPRYMGCMFPAYWLIAAFTDEHKEFELPIAVMSAVLFGVYLTGYLTVHSIM